MLGLLDWAPRDLIVRTSRSKRSADFIALLEQIDTQYGLTPDRATKPIVLVLDNGPIHTSKATRAALAERASWRMVEWLPKYAPELNDIEELWRDLKQHHLAHQTFAGPENLDDAIHEAVTMLNCERSRHPLANHYRCLDVHRSRVGTWGMIFRTHRIEILSGSTKRLLGIKRSVAPPQGMRSSPPVRHRSGYRSHP